MPGTVRPLPGTVRPLLGLPLADQSFGRWISQSGRASTSASTAVALRPSQRERSSFCSFAAFASSSRTPSSSFLHAHQRELAQLRHSGEQRGQRVDVRVVERELEFLHRRQPGQGPQFVGVQSTAVQPQAPQRADLSDRRRPADRRSRAAGGPANGPRGHATSGPCRRPAEGAAGPQPGFPDHVVDLVIVRPGRARACAPRWSARGVARW